MQDLDTESQIAKVPVPVSHRAEQLCQVLDEAGEHRPTRQFLVAALIATTEPDPKKLADRLRSYRTARVHEVVLGETETEGEITLAGDTE